MFRACVERLSRLFSSARGKHTSNFPILAILEANRILLADARGLRRASRRSSIPLTTTQLPSNEQEILAAVHALEPAIRSAADTIEAERHLPTPLARALAEAGVFRMGVPRAY